MSYGGHKEQAATRKQFKERIHTAANSINAIELLAAIIIEMAEKIDDLEDRLDRTEFPGWGE